MRWRGRLRLLFLASAMTVPLAACASLKCPVRVELLAPLDRASRDYRAIPSAGPPCTLEISAADAFVLQCQRGPALRGTVHRFKNWFSLARKTALFAEPSFAVENDEYRAAFHLHMRQHFQQHGFYPVIAPQPLADRPETVGCIMVSVQYRGREYLVDLFERESMCRAARAGRELKRTPTQHRVFVRRDPGVEPGTLSYEDFCSPQWRPLFK